MTSSMIQEVLSGLAPEQERPFLHTLLCDSCRGIAVATLLHKRGVGLLLPRSVKTGGGEPEPAGAVPLLAELLGHPPEERARILDQPRFRRPAVIEQLLRLAEEQQLANPDLADHLAALAAHRAARIRKGIRYRSGLLTRAAGLRRNALRLAGDLAAAASPAIDPPYLGAPPEERARYERSLGLVRWEQGMLIEAAQLLHQSAAHFAGEAGQEEGATLTLLGLLRTEQGSWMEALSSLMAGLALLDRGERPWLAARGIIALALGWAARDRKAEARSLLERARLLRSQVEDAGDRICLEWLEGRALDRAGESEEAIQLLTSARAAFLWDGRLPEAALATLDLAFVLARYRQPETIPGLIAQIEERFAAAPGVDGALTILRMANWAEPWTLAEQVATAETYLRKAFRVVGLRVDPLPFA